MPGTVLLLAAAPAGKGCLVDAASVLPVLAAVPPAVLSGTDTANVACLQPGSCRMTGGHNFDVWDATFSENGKVYTTGGQIGAPPDRARVGSVRTIATHP